MYHCHILFYFIGGQDSIVETVREMPPLENFTHDFAQSERPDAALLARADVILADVRGMDTGAALPPLTGGMKPEAELIVLADREQVPALAEAGSAVRDIWIVPMGEDEVRFRFLRWQQGCKLAKDCWQAEQFLDAAIEGTPNLVWYKGLDGVHERVNSRFSDIVGKPRDQVQGQKPDSIWDAAQPDPTCLDSEDEAMRSGATCTSEEIVRTDDGDQLITTYKSPLYDLDGSVMGTVGVAINMTREREYEREIMEKNQALEMLFSSMDCGVVCHSVDGSQILSINEAALKLLDYGSMEEMLADGFFQVAQSVLDEDKPKLRECIASLKKAGDSASVEYRVRHRDGKLLHLLGNVKLVEKDGEQFYQRFMLDFTAQKQQEEREWAKKNQEIQYQEQIFEVFSTFLSDNVDDVYMMMDETGRSVEFVTPNIERVLGVSAKAILDDAWAIGHAEYITGHEVGNEGLAALAPGMALEPMETKRIHQKTGEEKWFRESVYCVPVQGAKKIVVYISDRTKEHQAQKILSEALEMAQVASRAKSSFLSSVSHDIRTPMNAIMGFVELLREESDNAEQVLEYTQKISAASQHLLGLINDVLDMNKIESGNTVLNIDQLNLAEIVEGLNTIIRPQAKAKEQTFEIFVSALAHEDLLGDKLRINQILINILSNAVKYTPKGGRIELRVTELPQTDSRYDRIQFVVSDNGMGMSEDYLKVIFDPFTREQSTLLNKIQGTGLGMAITKNLVDLMNGSISVTSAVGEGSTFTVELELRIQEEKGSDSKFWEANGIARMIVADDDEDICQNIAKRMNRLGVETHYATHGEDALQAISAALKAGRPYDLILLDWKMPGLDGLETARLIRKNHSDKTPILLFTAYDWSEIEQEAMELGIRHFLPKPFFMSNFKEAVQRMLGGRPASARQEEKRSVLKGLHTLVVDDIEVNRLILTKILSTLGAECETACDGQEALEKFEASQPGQYDIIFMDVQMPRLNGYEASQAIRASAHPRAGQVPIIAMTANAFMDDIRDALEAGMDAHLSKPIVIDQMQTTVQEVLERKGLLSH